MNAPIPQIYSVMMWTKNDDGTWKVDCHYVAGHSSADAEERIKATNGDFLTGICFINTDLFMEEYPQPARMYATRMRNDDAVSEHEFIKWKKRSLHEQWNDGDIFPPAFRGIKVKK
jgi:hypothetical protein